MRRADDAVRRAEVFLATRVRMRSRASLPSMLMTAPFVRCPGSDVVNGVIMGDVGSGVKVAVRSLPNRQCRG